VDPDAPVKKRRRSRRGEGGRVRGELVVAADALLHERGSVEAVTIADVVGRVGVTPPVLYQHFDDKEALFVAVHAHRMEDFRDHLRRATHGATTPYDALERRGRAYVDYAVSKRDAYRALFLTPGSMGPDVLGDPSGRALTAFDDLVANVQACIDAGDIAGRDAELVARVAWGHIHGLASMMITMPSVADAVGREALVDETLRSIALYVLDG
jgi:AcrR family transcriptional regulator